MSIITTAITKTYGTQRALDNVSIAVKKGEITGFLGPNGAGKSTLLKILTTCLKPTDGQAQICGLPIYQNQLQVQRKIGYLPENNPLQEDMFIREYLQFCASIYKIPKSRIDEVIIQTGLTPEAHKKIGALSKGYKQRVGLAAAILHEPEVLILDEPTTGLDPNQLVDIRKLIKKLGRDKTVLLSTHIMQEVEALCDRVLIITKGKIVADRQLAELQEGREQIIEVEFDYRVEEVALQQLPKVSSVRNSKGFIYEITFDTQKDMRATLFDFAHDNGLRTLQLNRKNTSLEHLFQELTT
ncbi:MAG: gliding motility-associated ABC transporter ATP-binding subunit GldA [Leeuwenhoekiella sp.]